MPDARSNQRPWLLKGFFALVLMAGALGVATWVVSSMILHPFWHQPGEPGGTLPRPAHGGEWERHLMGLDLDPRRSLGLDFEEIQISTADGWLLSGWFIPPPPGHELKAAVITVHGGGRDRRDWLRQAAVFHHAGLGVLMFDCREHGTSQSQGRGLSFGWNESLDIRAAVDWLENREIEHIIAAGVSQGAAAVILAAASDQRIDAVMISSAFTSLEMLLEQLSLDGLSIPGIWVPLLAKVVRWRLGAMEAPTPLEKISAIPPRPLWLLHSGADIMVPCSQALKFYQAASGASLWLPPEAEHARLFNQYPQQYSRRLAQFIAEQLQSLTAGTPTERVDEDTVLTGCDHALTP